jgi:hypothetical protein
MRQSFVAAIVLFAFSVQTISGQTQTTPTSETSESDEVRRLRKTVSDQADQLAAQQVQTNALQSCFAEQKALLMKLLNPNAPPPSPAAPAAGVTPAPPEVAVTPIPPPTVAVAAPMEAIASGRRRSKSRTLRTQSFGSTSIRCVDTCRCVRIISPTPTTSASSATNPSDPATLFLFAACASSSPAMSAITLRSTFSPTLPPPAAPV